MEKREGSLVRINRRAILSWDNCMNEWLKWWLPGETVYLKKKRRKNARSDSIESGSKCGGKFRAVNETGYIKSMALNEPFRDTGQLRDCCANPEKSKSHLRHYGARSDAIKAEKIQPRNIRLTKADTQLKIIVRVLKNIRYINARQCCDLISIEMEGLYLWIVHFINERDNARWSHWILNVLISNHLPRLFHNSTRKSRGRIKNIWILRLQLLSDKVFRLTIKIMCMKECV